MKRYSTEDILRTKLRKKLEGKSQKQLAKEIGISEPMLSMLLSPRYPFTGKAVSYLGYKKVKETLFEEAA